MNKKPKTYSVLVLVVEPEKAEYLADFLIDVDGVIGTVDCTRSTVRTRNHINFLPIRIEVPEVQS